MVSGETIKQGSKLFPDIEEGVYSGRAHNVSTRRKFSSKSINGTQPSTAEAEQQESLLKKKCQTYQKGCPTFDCIK